MIKFGWDPQKARLNWQRHQVAFEEAQEAFFDRQAVEIYDKGHSWEETRYNLIGMSSRELLFIVYSEPEEDVIHIISARKAERKHQRSYERQRFG